MMTTTANFKKIALSFPGAEELPHFEKSSFRVKKKIFATLNEKLQRGCVKLSAVDQSAFCAFDATVVYPVPGTWGKQGWTFIELKKVRKETLVDALATAYNGIGSKISPSKSPRA